MKKIFSFSFVLALVFTACKNNAGNQVAPPPPVSSPAQQIPAPTAPQPNAAPVNPQAQPANVALNPKHGQPGHRCDIPEGAPLNSAVTNPVMPQVNAATPVVSQPAPVMAQPAANPNGGSVRLNPAHGQPGHDCAVPVGQPLKN
ncbi:MAG TPA: hypothetical protein VGC29_09820 [Flavisolibacter sp.]